MKVGILLGMLGVFRKRIATGSIAAYMFSF